MISRVLWVLSLCLLPVFALAQENWVAGEHYDVIAPAQRTQHPDKIEAAEFFWYGCGHCYQFEPVLSKWKKTLPEDAYFRGIPAMWGGAMELHARAFYAAELLGVLDTVGPAMFTAMNVDHKPLKSKEEIAAVFTANGVDAGEFAKAFDSFGVGSQVRQANASARAAKVPGTPALMINGKYLVSARKAGNYANMLKIADFLIAQERAAMAQPAPAPATES